MRPRMVERVCLGWDRPFLLRAVEWLLARRDELPRMLVVVPTAQGGRRLREALAERAETAGGMTAVFRGGGWGRWSDHSAIPPPAGATAVAPCRRIAFTALHGRTCIPSGFQRQ